jgi:uncharacterized protein (TIGR04255 family)
MNDPELYYSHDPIVEAIIGVAVERLAPDRLKDLDLLQTEAGPEYTKKRALTLYEFEGELRMDQNLGPRASASTSQVQIGYTMQTKDGRQTFEARLDGFTYHHLAPYPRWTAFRSEGQRLWAIYRKLIMNQPIIHGELRYINRLEVPAGQELSLSLQTYPEVGREVPQTLLGYHLEAKLQLQRMPGEVVIRQQMAPLASPGHVSIILDNTLLFGLGESLSDDALWARMEEARHEKNRIFRGCITPAMEDRIK